MVQVQRMKILGLTPSHALTHIRTRISVNEFEQWCKLHRKDLGTAWYEALEIEDKNILQNCKWDPYGTNRWQNILVALAYLQNPALSDSELIVHLGNPLMAQK